MLQRQRLRVVFGLVLTLVLLNFVPNRALVLFLLLVCWAAVLSPVSRAELIAFAMAALFFLLQNYVCLKAGLFEFRFKDVLLMPYYEPFLWGFYFIGLKRMLLGTARDGVTVDVKSVIGLLITSLAFSLFSYDSRTLLLATACSTAVLFAMFHTALDLRYAAAALALGFVLEQFGVSTGLWLYPAPDFLGLPYWFFTMWIGVGLLGRRFLFPAAEWVSTRLVSQRA